MANTDLLLAADKGLQINAVLLRMQHLLKDPKLGLTLAQCNEIDAMVSSSQQLLTEVTGVRLNVTNIFDDVVDESVVALLRYVMNQLHASTQKRLNTRIDKVEALADRVATNIVTGKEYRIFAIAYLSDGSRYYGGISNMGHHIFASDEIWGELRTVIRS